MHKTLSPLDPAFLKVALSRTIFCRNIVYEEVVDSTNELAKELAQGGAVHGTLVICEDQRAGRGRKGRRWLSAPYKNLLFSVLLRPSLGAKDGFWLTGAMAVSASEAIWATTGIKAQIKWPNDIYLSGKKAGGILTEVLTQDHMIRWAVVGVGLNVNWAPSKEFICISEKSGLPLDRGVLLVELLGRYHKYLKKLGHHNEEIMEKYETRSLLRGKEVVIREGKGRGAEIVRGEALGIDSDGGLFVKGQRGELKKIIYGDVTVLRWQ
ncbi:MAG TPA: biotin--[acetyl-CoA-carboxylase] ligase [Desulfobacterales bacterium]|nr:biotin--[acetyl-CoA-carboxylase] ligase [Desulfobacterales bacterium]